MSMHTDASIQTLVLHQFQSVQWEQIQWDNKTIILSLAVQVWLCCMDMCMGVTALSTEPERDAQAVSHCITHSTINQEVL